MIQVGLDLSLALSDRGGTGRYARQLTAALEHRDDVEVNRFATSWPFASSEARLGRMLRLLLLSQAGAALAARGRLVDVLHLPQPIGSVISRTPRVVTVHDLIFRRWPQDYRSAAWRHYLRPMFDWQIRRARVIVTDSEAVRSQVLTMYRLHPDHVLAVHLGVDTKFQRPWSEEALSAVRDRYHLPDAYVLFVGTLIRRKNVPRLALAFAQALRQLDDRETVLVILGNPLVGLAGAEEAMSALATLRPERRILHITSVAEEDLAAVYRLARALILPSLDEGFGLPIVEAMACGTAVISSDIPVLAEVAGAAAHLVAPQSVASIAEGIATVLRDDDYRRHLAQKGMERARGLTWEATAEGTLAAYRRALAGSKVTC